MWFLYNIVTIGLSLGFMILGLLLSPQEERLKKSMELKAALEIKTEESQSLTFMNAFMIFALVVTTIGWLTGA